MRRRHRASGAAPKEFSAQTLERRGTGPSPFPTRLSRARLLFLRRREVVANWLALAVLLSLGIVWPPVFGQGLAPEQMRSGSLLLKASADGEAIEALRVATEISAQVTANVARVRVTQRFRNPTDDWVEGLYVFPLSATAAVDELEMHIAERTIRGEIQPRRTAHTIYEKARREGRRAALVDQERPNLFTSAAANIAPHSEVSVEIAYLDTVPLRDGRYSLRLPLAITPRFTPGVAIDAQGPLPLADAARANALLGTSATPERVTSERQHVAIEVILEPGFPLASLESLHHPVSIVEDDGARRVRLAGEQIAADRDFELVWTAAAGVETHAAAFVERAGDSTYALVFLTPPEEGTGEVRPREVVFIIDTSGSMGGPSIRQAREALRLGIERLRPQDYFNVIRFSDDASSLFDASRPADGASRALAARFIDSLHASGGTQMRAALDLVFAMPPVEGALRQIVFVTDGSVGNEAEFVSLIAARIGEARLFTVGIGAAPNEYFMREAAAAGRGGHTFIADVRQVRERMDDLFRKLGTPALVDLELHWPGGTNAELAAPMPRDLYAGDPLVVAARLPEPPRGLLTLSGRSGSGFWVRQVPLVVRDGQAGIAKLWARERIAQLSRRKRLGGDPAAIDAQILQLALDHHLVSELTSLVAVDVTPVRPAGIEARTEQAPTSAPAGSYWARTTGFATTATRAPLLLVLGVLSLLCAFVWWAMLRTARAARVP